MSQQTRSTQPQASSLDLGALLNAIEADDPVRTIRVFSHTLMTMIGATDVRFLIADFSGDALIRFVSSPDDAEMVAAHDDDNFERVPLSGSRYEEAIRSQEVNVERHGDVAHLIAPVTDRGDAIGAMELRAPAPVSNEVRQFVASAAHALAYVIISARRHTDMFERGQRNVPFTLAAEIQRRLLPAAFACEATEFTLAGWLEPASHVGGDTFDYNAERDALDFSISDAMGHTVQAAQLATLAVGSLRNSRRAGSSMSKKAQAANQAINEYAHGDQYVSALLMRLNSITGEIVAVNAGHPSAYLARGGDVTQIVLPANLPFGMMPNTQYHEHHLQLERGDRLVLLTDGMLERNASALDVPEALERMTELHPREVVHNFARAVLTATDGQLADDATVLCVDWYGPQSGDGNRVARAGASQARVSVPDIDLT